MNEDFSGWVTNNYQEGGTPLTRETLSKAVRRIRLEHHFEDQHIVTAEAFMLVCQGKLKWSDVMCFACGRAVWVAQCYRSCMCSWSLKHKPIRKHRGAGYLNVIITQGKGGYFKSR